MSEVETSESWREQLASLVDNTGMSYTSLSSYENEVPMSSVDASVPASVTDKVKSSESEKMRDQVTEFAKAWSEMLVEFGKGCRDIVKQSILTEDSFIVQKLGGHWKKISGRLSFLNEYLPEDRDPAHAWSVIFLVFILALIVLNVNNKHDSSAPPIKKVSLHPPSASRVLLPDGRYLAYHELGISAEGARFSVIAVHSFLSSRLAGLPGLKVTLLEEFGVRFITYDLPGFGESDPHPKRNLNSSAFDILHLANAVGVTNKFWVWGFSSGGMHVLAALKYIPDSISGVTMFAPILNPYDPSMTKEVMSKIWEKWTLKKRYMYFLARRFPSLLTIFYRRSFFSGKHDRIDTYLSLSLGKKDSLLIDEPIFEEFWQRDVEESIRQGNPKPFIEESALLVSNWGFRLEDLQVQKKCSGTGILSWLKSIYSPVECELTGYQGPIHIWQGLDDLVAPPSMSDYIGRVLPAATLHKLPNEGHFSYFFFCHECHSRIFSALFGSPQGPLNSNLDSDNETLAIDDGIMPEVASSPVNSMAQ